MWLHTVILLKSIIYCGLNLFGQHLTKFILLLPSSGFNAYTFTEYAAVIQGLNERQHLKWKCAVVLIHIHLENRHILSQANQTIDRIPKWRPALPYSHHLFLFVSPILFSRKQSAEAKMFTLGLFDYFIWFARLIAAWSAWPVCSGCLYSCKPFSTHTSIRKCLFFS